LPRLFPFFDAKPIFANNPAAAEVTGFRNSTLQAAYFILALRAVGLHSGGMSGFDNAGVDEAFFKGTSLKSNFILNIGYGDASKRYPRAPRFNFEEVASFA
jgi:3-hydroxypropanoate dehydrogenase